jgi:hypothetical protein
LADQLDESYDGVMTFRRDLKEIMEDNAGIVLLVSRDSVQLFLMQPEHRIGGSSKNNWIPNNSGIKLQKTNHGSLKRTTLGNLPKTSMQS